MSVDLSVDIAGVKIKNPILAASGTFGFGMEYEKFFDVSLLGAIALKALTLKPRIGNPPPRIAETPSGIINSIGLQNPGVEKFLAEQLSLSKKLGTVLIANIAGESLDEYCELADILSDAHGIDMLEVNVSCPNVRAGGLVFGSSPDGIYDIAK